jgi:hypothetical protein
MTIREKQCPKLVSHLGWQTVLAGAVWTGNDGTTQLEEDTDQVLLGKAVSVTDKYVLPVVC